METGVSGLPASGADSACVPASGSHASRDWLSRLKRLKASIQTLLGTAPSVEQVKELQVAVDLNLADILA